MPTSKRKIETHTAKPLKAAKAKPQKKSEDPVQEILNKLHEMAIDSGNTSAAKIYLDVVLKQKGEDTDALTPEEALKILREQQG